MATIKVILVLFLGLLFVDCFNPPQPTKHAPPRIFNFQDEMVVDSGRNLTLTCEGTEPVTWKYPNDTIDGFIWSQVVIQISEEPSEKLYKYRTRLTLENASYVDTGFYICHEEKSDYENPLTSRRTYVYVRDEYHLSTRSDTYGFLQAKQYSNILVPCRPTSPDVTVTLEDTYTNEISYISYDPKFGFMIRVESVSDSGYYICTYSLGGQTETEEFHLYVSPTPTSVNQPYIMASNHTSVGENFILECKVIVDSNVYFQLIWEVPDPSGLKNGRIIPSNGTRSKDENLGVSFLNISKVQKSDDGIYTCIIKDHANNTNNGTKYVKVLGIKESFINLSEEFGVTHIKYSSARAKEPYVQWNIKVASYPKAKIMWVNNKNMSIEPGMGEVNKYYARVDGATTLFKINNVELGDSGTYMVRAFNEIEEKQLSLYLTVEVKPTVDIVSQLYHPYGKKSEIICNAVGYPLPKVHWYFKPCLDDKCIFEEIPIVNYTIQEVGWNISSKIYIEALDSGYLKCEAQNSEGNDSNTIGFFVTDIDEGFNVWGVDITEIEGIPQTKVAVGDDVTINCGASIHNYTSDIYWSRKLTDNIDDDQQIILRNDKKFTIEKNETEFTNRITLIIKSITKNESGIYVCNANKKDEVDYPKIYFFRMIVSDPQKPVIYFSNMNNTELTLNIGKPLQWKCLASGLPKPTIIWTKNNQDWSIGSNQSRISLIEDNTVMSFSYTQIEDDGIYACKAKNRVGWDKKEMTLTLLNKSKQDTAITVVLIIMSIFFFIVLVILVIRVRREKRIQYELRKAGLINFEKGALDSLNPELGVDDQAELLPYDKKWEFPREKLKLGKQLGSGAFGVVMKAEAFGITDGEGVSTVAVKMVKRNADFTYIKALASELKIMVHLGKNLNVVNLLGACTKNVTKRELLVIVEYCRYGNLHNYLLRHRDGFINQIDPKTHMIDVNIGADILNRTLSVGSTQSRFKLGSLSSGSGKSSIPCAGVDYRATPNPNSNETEITVCMTPSPTTAGEDMFTLSTSGTQQPEWRSNYRGDYNKGNVKPICTSDLLCWAFQVARGMDYLASRKVLHGDLAARNILLAEDNIVKICDFGLAKSMYKSDNYKKKGDGPLPIKWMAVESIRDRVFSTQSDIWSYGIVLWEFFSLARTPYPGMEADERLYQKLVEGYRMDQPEFATKELYKIMMQCWSAKPIDRPSFTQLSESLGNSLNETVRNHYIDLNTPYLTMNHEMLEGHSDYLLMLNSPDYGNLASPHKPIYVNDIQFHELDNPPAESSGYLCMKAPTDIFSPRADGDQNSFDFENHKKQKSNGEIATGVELLPILHVNNDLSDGELSPTYPKSFSNPSYQKGLTIVEPTEEDIVKTTDNYINMPQQKVLIKNNSKPSFVQMNDKDVKNDVNSKNYVNSQSRDWERPYLS